MFTNHCSGDHTILGYYKNGRPIRAIRGGAPTVEEVRTTSTPAKKAEQIKTELLAIKSRAEEEGRDLTEDESAEVRTKSAERKKFLDEVKNLEWAVKELEVLGAPDDPAGDDSKVPDDSKGDRPRFKTLGTGFVRSTGFQKNKDRFKDESFRARGNVGSGAEILGFKATIGVDSPASTFPTGQQFPTVDLTGPEDTSLLNLISHGTMTQASLRYLQINGVTEGAGIVAAGDLKPLSDLDTSLATAEAYTYADGFAVSNQALADEPFLASYLQARLPRHLRNAIQSMILGGTGTGGQPAGILSTTGVLQVPWDGGLAGDPNVDRGILDTIADAMEAVEDNDGVVQAIAVAPADYWRIMKLKDDMGRYYSQGPWSQGPGTVWGARLVKVRRLTAGQAILGEWSTVFLLDREGVSVVAFNQHADYAQRNLTYVRGEYRGAQMIVEPTKLAVADLTP